jgi:hypothetical protein
MLKIMSLTFRSILLRQIYQYTLIHDDAFNKIITNDIIYSQIYVFGLNSCQQITILFFLSQVEYACVHVESIRTMGNLPMNNCFTSGNQW